jgi:hypothetical protein
MSEPANVEPKSDRKWTDVFALDARSLAAMRVGLGLVLLLNLCDLAWDLPAFYTDAGLLPRAARMELNVEEEFVAPPYWVSLHMASGEAWFQGLLFAVSGLLAVGVMIGYRTQWALFGSWLLFLSLKARNPLLLQGGDDVLRVLLFWSLFLPLGAKWSYDARRGAEAGSPRILSLGSAALILQLVCLYLFTALLKKHAMWRTDFTAIYYALSTDHFTSLLGRELLNFPHVLQCLTLATMALELGGPLVLLFPWRSWKVRTAVVVSFWLFHLGIASTMRIGLFPATCLVYWLALVPGGFWDWLEFRLRRVGVLTSGGLLTRPAEAGTTNWPAQALSIKLLLGALLVYVVLLNVVRLRQSIYINLNPSPLRSLGEAAGLNQFWCMFSPRPADFGGWYRVEGILPDGRRVNLFDPSSPPHHEKPALVSAIYPSLRWRKIMVNLFELDCPTHRRSVGEYFLRRWNESHGPDEQLVSAEIVLMLDPTPLPRMRNDPRPPAESLVIWQWARAR